MEQRIQVSAPGSLMLLGEHAVLRGESALVAAINQRIRVELTPNQDAQIQIHSALGEHIGSLGAIGDHPKLRFVLAAIGAHEQSISTGFDLRISAPFSDQVGFGSSAAVSVAVHGALLRWIEGAMPTQEHLFRQALATMRSVQGRGSGADIAASVYGGVVAYRMDAIDEVFPIATPISAIYCGYKCATPEVLARMEEAYAQDPAHYDALYKRIGACADQGIRGLRAGDLQEVARAMELQQTCMVELGLNTAELDEIVAAMQPLNGLSGTKISGSGLGDCVVAFGSLPEDTLEAYARYVLMTSPEGCVEVTSDSIAE
jgi:mevalonate kinase